MAAEVKAAASSAPATASTTEAAGATTPAVRPNLSGKWKEAKVEGMDEYLKAMGCPWLLRKVILSDTVALEIDHDVKANTWGGKRTNRRGTKLLPVVAIDGHEYDDNDQSGKACKCSTSWTADGAVRTRMVGGVSAEEYVSFSMAGSQLLVVTHHPGKNISTSRWFDRAAAV